MHDGRALFFAVEPKTDGLMMGCVAATKPHDDDRRAELGFWLGEAYHGKGYTTEAADTILRAAFATLDIDVIQGGAQPENAASVRVMRKLGMQPIGQKNVWSTARNREEICWYFEIRRADAQRVIK